MRLFKYLTLEATKLTLKNNNLKATRPKNLDDPWEYYFRIQPDPIKFMLDGANKEAGFKHFSQDIANRLARRGICEPTEDDFRIETGSLIEEISPLIEAKLLEISKAVAKSSKERADQLFAVVCLTKNENCADMWSRYAEGSRGAVIEFETNSHEYSIDKSIIAIRYRDTPIILKANSLDELIGKYDRSDILGWKHQKWEDQQEYRIEVPTEEFEKHPNSKGSYNGQEILNFWFPPSTVRRVIFGSETTARVREPLISVLEESRYTNVTIDVAKLSDEDYSLTYKTLRRSGQNL